MLLKSITILIIFISLIFNYRLVGISTYGLVHSHDYVSAEATSATYTESDFLYYMTKIGLLILFLVIGFRGHLTLVLSEEVTIKSRNKPCPKHPQSTRRL